MAFSPQQIDPKMQENRNKLPSHGAYMYHFWKPVLVVYYVNLDCIEYQLAQFGFLIPGLNILTDVQC